jgi:hypothetical protein
MDHYRFAMGVIVILALTTLVIIGINAAKYESMVRNGYEQKVVVSNGVNEIIWVKVNQLPEKK